MAIRKILPASDPKLRQKAKKVKRFDTELKALADDMIETMHDAPGVGLAGPQIGVMERIFVAELPLDETNPLSGKPFVMVNPELTKVSVEMEEAEEGCLSMPGWAGLVERYYQVEIKARDVNGRPIKFKADGYLARIFQHENDHLDGILFVDHIKDDDKLWQLETENQPDKIEA